MKILKPKRARDGARLRDHDDRIPRPKKAGLDRNIVDNMKAICSLPCSSLYELSVSLPSTDGIVTTSEGWWYRKTTRVPTAADAYSQQRRFQDANRRASRPPFAGPLPGEIE